MHAFYSYLYFENTANILDIVQYIVLHSLFSTKAFLVELFKNFEEQVEGFLSVPGDSLLKNSAIQPKSVKAIKLNHFNVLNARCNSMSLILLLFCDTNSL